MRSTTTKIIKVNDIDQITIPSALKQYILEQQEAKLVLIHYDGSALSAYTREPEHYTTAAFSVLTTLQKIIASKQYKLLPGHYLLAIDDGVHQKLAHPVLAFAATRDLVNDHSVFLIPDHQVLKGYADLFAKIDVSSKQNPWDNKSDKIFWRGGHSVDYTHNNNDFEHNKRLKFINYARHFAFSDVGISNSNLYIHPDLKRELIARNLLKTPILPQDSLASKYLFDLDGYSCSYVRMAWILYSNSMLMKHTSDRMQWYYAQLQPYVHYVPIAADFSNLQQQFEWAQTHPEDARAIAENGHELAKKIFAAENVMRSLEQGFLKYYILTQSTVEK